MEAPNQKFKIILFGSITVFGILIFLLTWYINRNKPFLNTILWFIVILTIFGIFAGIVYLIVWLFRRHKIDLLFVMKNQILESCKINEPDQKTEIVLYDNKNTKHIGQYLGFTMIKTAEWMGYIDDKSQEEQKFYNNFLKINQQITEEYIYLIAFKSRAGKNEIMLCLEDDFSDLNTNPVVLYGKGFSPKLYEFIYLSKHYDVGGSIELPVKNLVNKYALEHNMRELVNIIDNAIDIDANFRKSQEKSNIDDFRPSQNGNNRG